MNFDLLPDSGFDFNKLTVRCLEVGHYSINLQNNKLWLSDKYCELLGFTADAVPSSVKKFIADFVHDADKQELISAIRDCYFYRKNSFQIYLRLMHISGTYRWFDFFGELSETADKKDRHVYGGIKDVTALKQNNDEKDELKLMLKVAEEMADIAILDKNFLFGEHITNKKVCEIFEVSDTTEWSITKAIDCFEDKSKQIIKKRIVQLKTEKKPFDEELLLTTVAGNKKWIRFTAKPVLNNEGEIMYVQSLIQNVSEKVSKELLVHNYLDKLEAQKYFLNERFSIAKLGGWEFNFETGELFWDAQSKTIHEVHKDYKPEIETAVNFYTDDAKIRLEHVMSKLRTEGTSYDEELQFITAKNKNLWIRTIGTPVYDDENVIIGARGVIQDITEAKLKSLKLEHSLEMITAQKEKLTNFAYLVSHNLRTHTSNLKLLSQIIEQENDSTEKLSWLGNIKHVSESLDESVNGLTEIVRSHGNVPDAKMNIQFSSAIDKIYKTINLETEEKIDLLTDFADCPAIESVPASLESIMMNLVTNAIKYRHPERKAKIRIKTYFKNGRPCLEISDNGRGIDLQTYGKKLFGLNQTFHGNRDARGIGLYITKNYVENLGGTIEAESKPNVGTTFKVTF